MSFSLNYSSLRPSLSLNFLKGESLDPRITFTRDSIGTYYDSTGVLRTASNNQPRFDYDPVTFAPRGLLIEEARTNQCTYSQNFTNAAWLPSGTTKTTGVADPWGGTTAATVTATTTAGNMQNATPTVVIGTTYTVSCWMRRRTGTGAVGIRAVENVNTPVTITSTWARYSVTATATQTIGRAGVYVQTIGDEIDVWGFQLEAGAFPTSYIPTTVGTVTREADMASVNTLSPWYNATEGTLYAEYNIPVDVQNQAAVALSDGTLTNRMIIRASNTSSQTVFLGIVANSAVWAGVVVTAPTNATTKSSFAYATNDIAWIRDAGTVGTDTSATIPTVTGLKLGADGDGSLFLNGYLRRITYYPRRLSNAQLQALTAS